MGNFLDTIMIQASFSCQSVTEFLNHTVSQSCELSKYLNWLVCLSVKNNGGLYIDPVALIG